MDINDLCSASFANIKSESIKVYLSGVRSLHLEHGLAKPLSNCLRLERVLRGIKRTQGGSTRQRLPVTFEILERFYPLLDLNRYEDTLFWAACCTAFYVFLRSGEITTSSNKFDSRVHLALSDIKVDRNDNTKVLIVTTKCSKTDPFRRGHVLRIGVSKSQVCAAKPVVHYLHRRGGSNGALFMHQNGLPLTRATLTTWLQEMALRAGLEGNFSGHSCRIGAASTAASVGIPDHLIKTLGRWLSNAYQLNIRTPTEILDSMAARMAHK